MSAETKKEALLEYPIKTVYTALVGIFPYKYYRLREYDEITYTLIVIDSFNPTFIMDIMLDENTPNTTIINFIANYPHAISDLTGGGLQAIETILEELLNRLDKQPKTGATEAQNTAYEVVNRDNFVNTSKNRTHTLTIMVGYVLTLLSIILPLTALLNYNPDDFLMVMSFIVGIVSLSMEISVSVILQYYEDKNSIRHGRIQLCLCGLSLIVLGILLHPSLAVAGVLIPVVAISYFIKRERSIK